MIAFGTLRDRACQPVRGTLVTRPPCTISRRHFLLAAGQSSIGLGLSGRLAGQARPREDVLAPLNRFPRMVQEWFVEQVRAAENRRHRRPCDAQDEGRRRGATSVGVREKIATCFGPFPEKTPLNAKVTGMVERDAYRIEKVIFESRPGVPRHRQSLPPEGREGPAAGRGRLLRPFRQRQGRAGLSVVRPGAGAAWATSC